MKKLLKQSFAISICSGTLNASMSILAMFVLTNSCYFPWRKKAVAISTVGRISTESFPHLKQALDESILTDFRCCHGDKGRHVLQRAVFPRSLPRVAHSQRDWQGVCACTGMEKKPTTVEQRLNHLWKPWIDSQTLSESWRSLGKPVKHWPKP